MSQAQTPFEPSTGHLDEAGTPPVTPETQVEPLSADTIAVFNARATEAEIQADLREKLMNLLAIAGEVVVQKLLKI
jgi:hypothetical protein